MNALVISQEVGPIAKKNWKKNLKMNIFYITQWTKNLIFLHFMNEKIIILMKKAKLVISERKLSISFFFYVKEKVHS